MTTLTTRLQLTARTIVLDIEGTTSAAGYIAGDLYRYARPRLGPFIDEHGGDPRVAIAVAQTKHAAELPEDAPTGAVVEVLHGWMDQDLKAAPLKTLQGLIWAQGFAQGELTSHFFEDVIPGMRGWHAAGLRLAIFSSGSTAAQHAWLAHSPEGDLTPLIDGFFDTVSAGSKKEESSYRLIAKILGVEPELLLFLTDHPEEIAAARRAGWQAVAVRRAGEPHQHAAYDGAAEISDFDALEVVTS